MSPAQRAFARKTSALAAASTAASSALQRPTSGAEATEYELQRERLGVDLKRLKDIQSIERKIDLKRELIANYDPWVGGVLDAAANGARGVQDDILTHMMIWRIDTGDFAGALPLVEYVLRWGLALPERFNRTAATMIAEEIAEAALKRLDQGEEPKEGFVDLELLLTIDDLTADHDMHDEVRAKLAKALGRELARQADAADESADGPAGGKRAAIEAALKRLRRARELNAKAGVKKDIERLEREARKLTESTDASS
ncbi:MAG TPA: phage terminase small subunit [Allosphingosinicella sp.]|jgi:hypothetical protein